MTFQELGAMLRAEREKHGLDINDVANQLKINPRQLRAIEDGDVESLPHPAYVRGFIRSYASLLGLGQEEIQQDLDSLTQGPLQTVAIKQEEFAAPENDESQSSHKGLYFLLALCVLAGCAWYLWDSGKLDFLRNSLARNQAQVGELQSADTYMAAKDAEKARQSVAEQKVEPARQAEKAVPLPGIAPITAPAQPQTEMEKTAPAETVAEEPRPETPSAPAATAAPPEPATPGQHKLIITAIEECWVHSNADRTDTRQFSLRKGDTFALTFADSLELKLGNAGGVRLRYDGNDLPAPGSSGQVRTLVFPPKSNS